MTVVIVAVVTVTVVIFATEVIVTVATVAVGTVVILKYFSKKRLDTSTTDQIFSGQLFAILAMFCSHSAGIDKYSVCDKYNFNVWIQILINLGWLFWRIRIQIYLDTSFETNTTTNIFKSTKMGEYE